MSKEMMAVIAFGAICLFAVVMLLLERRAAARRLKARGGREVDVASLIFFGSKAGKGEVTHH
jgi:nitrate reductase gamma subunit